MTMHRFQCIFIHSQLLFSVSRLWGYLLEARYRQLHCMISEERDSEMIKFEGYLELQRDRERGTLIYTSVN